MATTTFETGTVITKEWLQDVNDVVYGDASIDAEDVTVAPSGTITATSTQAALEQLDTLKAPKASPVFTGTATIPAITGMTTPLSVAQGGTGAASNAAAPYALKGANTDITSLNAPALGAATATTQAVSDNSTKVATTAFVKGVVSFGCKAWVNFNGATGTIRGSGNVSSVTRSNTGDYVVNFTTAMENANYAAIASRSLETDGTVANDGMALIVHSYTTTSVSLHSGQDNGPDTDPEIFSLAVFG